MSENIINALPREGTGKGGARQLRMTGRIPGVFYYGSDVNIRFSVDKQEMIRLMRNRHTTLRLAISGDEVRECVIRELQRDPVSSSVVHIDLLGIQSGQKIVVVVPLKLTGLPIGVKSDGGILQHGATMVSVECLPGDIPEEIVVDVSELKLGQSLYLESVELPGIRFMGEPKTVLATVATPTAVKADAPSTAPGAAEKTE